MQITPTEMDGCLLVEPIVHLDNRGSFVKTFQRTIFEQCGVAYEFPEQFFSRSHRGVLRGLHFQAPPRAQAKLVFCVFGAVFDVVVDIRRGSPTYGRHAAFMLDDRSCRGLFVPAGFAHGFLVTTDEAIVTYDVTHEFDPELDMGIRWDSAGVDWPLATPVLSDKDSRLPAWDAFETPFLLAGHG